MYCPQCGTDNLPEASFCRGCGSNISLVPQAMTGSLQGTTGHHPEKISDAKRKDEPNIDKAVRNIFMGFGFLLAALAASRFMPGARTWWFWMLIPAFAMLGGGVAEFIRMKYRSSLQLPSAPVAPMIPPARRPAPLPQRRNTAELMQPPPSVTEGTTRHLGAEMPTRHLEQSSENYGEKS